MIRGIFGSLLSSDALETLVPDALHGQLDEAGRETARRWIRSWHEPLRRQLGPTMTARGLFDRLAAPLMSLLGYRVLPIGSDRSALHAVLQTGTRPVAVLLVTSWGQDLAAAWREAVTHGIGFGVRWCFCLSGPRLRLIDARRTYSRRFVEFDLQASLDDSRSFAVLWGLLRAEAMVGEAAAPLIDRAVAISETHRASVRDSLQRGVSDALQRLTTAFADADRSRRRKRPCTTDDNGDRIVEESLIVIYRMLFLLFAEARGLVPRWHPVYRDSYTIEALRLPVEMLPRPRGLWETLQAIARLAHRGCHAGSLRVPPFNGRLFSPAHAPMADTVPLDDASVRDAVLALTTRRCVSGRERISYSDLGVEQLGGIYERLLDFQPVKSRSPAGVATAGRRKATGTFYTPRSLTEYLVRRTLAPLVKDATPERLLALRVIDPAMGSGAFLVASCRYLAGAYEQALVREGTLSPADVTDAERAEFRRTVAQRCLFGIDVNPMAVQLGRLSLWLATLAADRPLTFLDHHLRAGNSLVGASPDDVARRPPPGHAAESRPSPLPLFGDTLGEALLSAIETRRAVATEPGDTLEQVRAKERALATLEREDTLLTRWKRVCDLWCSGWFRSGSERGAIKATFGSIVDSLLTRSEVLPRHVADSILTPASAVAERESFFHWPLEFPEVFQQPGTSGIAPGFDAVIGNPPWEMLRGDRGDSETRSAAREAASRLSKFARSSGIYTLQGDGHSNLYQLFLERAMKLLAPDGRLGIVLPSGIATDHGCALLRRALLERTEVDSFVGFENRDGLFPIHRGLKFVLLTARAGGRTTTVACRFGVRTVDQLDALPDEGSDPSAVPVSRPLIERFSGSDLAIPELRSRVDLEIVGSIAFSIPALGNADGWHVSFGRELNVTDDRGHFSEDGTGIPVIEGKHVRPFQADVASARFHVPRRVASRLAALRNALDRPRLAYREIASSTNRLTLIAAIVPRAVATAHTLFCLKDPLDGEAQLFLCGVFNSFVANYLVRLRVGTHVTAAILTRLPIPKPSRDSLDFREIVSCTAALHRDPDDRTTAARLQARAARLYSLDRDRLRHVLDSFPLVPSIERDAVMTAFAI